MAFKEVNTLDAENTTALGGTNRKTGKKNPTGAEGYFLGTRKVESKKSKTGFASIHFLQTPKGNLGIWGKTDLDRKLSAVAPGTMIRITQSGMTATPNGEMYKFKVEVDNDNTIEVAPPSADESFGASNNDDGGGGYNASSSEDEEDLADADDRFNEEEVSQSQALSALERKQKVEALLKGAGRPNRK